MKVWLDNDDPYLISIKFIISIIIISIIIIIIIIFSYLM